MPDIILKLIIRFFFRSVFRTFATFLILLGVSLLFPGLQEYLINLVIASINERLGGADLPPYRPEESPWGIFVAAGFIFAGFISFTIGVLVDKNKEENGREPVIKVYSDPIWLFNLDGDNNIYNPKVSTSVNLAIAAATTRVLLHAANLYRYVDGCPMLMGTPSLTRPLTDETISYARNWKSLQEHYPIPALEQVTLLLAREFRGPTMKYQFHQLQRGDLKIDIAYSLGNNPRVEQRTFYFRQDNGSLIEKDGIAKPHLLNDEVLAEALKNDVITQEEYDQIKKVTEQQRHLYIRDGDDFLSGYPELRAQPNLLSLIKDVNGRVWKMRDLHAVPASD